MRLQDDIDFTTLTWVKQELDDTLKQAQQALEAYVEDSSDKSQMRFCASYLHQVQGTLRMVELYGAAMVVEEMERLALGLLDGQIKQAEDAYTVLLRGMVQLPDYLERLQSGHRDIPIVLLPLLNDLRACRGEKLLSETALFSPDLSAALPPSAAGAKLPTPQPVLTANGGRLRLAFQFGLLKWFKGEDVDGNLTRLIAAVDRLRSMCVQLDARRLFWVAGGVLEAVLVKGVEASVALKLLIGRVDREIKRLIDGGEAAFSAQPPNELTKGLLYYVAQSTGNSQRVAELRQVYRLDKLIPSEAELEHARGALSGHNRALLDTVGTAIKEDLLRIKDAFDLYLRTGSSNVEELAPQGDALHRVADTLGMLGLGVPRRVVLDQKDVLERIVQGKQAAEESTLLDVAGSLLYVESSLDDHIERLGAEQKQESVPSSGFELPQAEVRKILDATTKEASANIQQAKQDIVAFIESPWDHSKIEQIPRLLEEISGAMRMLNLPEPAELLSGVVRFAEVELLKHRRVPSGDQLDLMADAIASIEFYLEAVKEGRRNRDKILDVTRRSLEALGYWPLPGSADTTPDVEEVVESAPAAADFPKFADTFTTDRVAPEAPITLELEPLAAPAIDVVSLPDAAAIDSMISGSSEVVDLSLDTSQIPDIPQIPEIQSVEIAPGAGLEALVVGDSSPATEPKSVELSGLEITAAELEAPRLSSEQEAFEATLEFASSQSDIAESIRDETALDLDDLIADVAPETPVLDLDVVDTSIEASDSELQLTLPEEPAFAGVEPELVAPVETALLEPVALVPPPVPAPAPAPAPVPAPAPAPAPAVPGLTLPDVGFHSVPSDEIDDEIREVFVEEVQDELDNLARQYPMWKGDLGDFEKLKPVRRSFHTLKGSGRLVGALAIGEFAWKIENMLNRVLDKTIQPTPAVLDLLDNAIGALPGMLAALKGEGQPNANLGTIMWVADQLATGQEVWLPKSSPAPVVTADQPAAVAGAEASDAHGGDTVNDQAVASDEAEQPSDVNPIDLTADDAVAIDADAHGHALDSGEPVDLFVGEPDQGALQDDSAILDSAPSEAVETVETIVFDEIASDEPAESAETTESGETIGLSEAVDVPADLADVGLETVGLSDAVETASNTVGDLVTPAAGSPLDVDPMLMEILSSEVVTHVAAMRQYLVRADAAVVPPPVTEELLRAVHTLNGALSMVDLPVLTRFVGPLEGYLKRLRAKGQEPSANGVAALRDAADCIERTMHAIESRVAVEPTDYLAERVIALRDDLPAPDHPYHGYGIHDLDDHAAPVAETKPWFEVDESEVAAEQIAGEASETLAAVEPVDAPGSIIEPWFESSHSEQGSVALDESGDSASLELIFDASDDGKASLLESNDMATAEVAALFDDIGAAELANELPAADLVPTTDAAIEPSELTSVIAEVELPTDNHDQLRAAAESELDRWLSDSTFDPAEKSIADELGELIESGELQDTRDDLVTMDDVLAVATVEDVEPLPLVALDGEAAAIEPEAIEPEAIEPEAIEPEAVEPEAVEPEATVETIGDLAVSLDETLPVDELPAVNEPTPVAFDEPQAVVEEVLETIGSEGGSPLALFEDFAEPSDELGAAETAFTDGDGRADLIAIEPESPTIEAVSEPSAPATTPGSSTPESDKDVDPPGALELPDLDLELLDIFVEEGVDILDHADGMMARLRETPDDRETVASLQRDLHTLKGGARMAGLTPIGDLSHAMESLFEAIAQGERQASRPAIESLERAFDRLHGMVQRVRSRQAIALPERTIARIELVLEGREAELLAPVEAPQASETPVVEAAPTSVPIVAPPEAATPAERVPPPPAPRPSTQRKTQLDEDEAAARAAQQELIRVRADLLDNLVNFAGEVSIYRSRLEAQMGGFRFNLVEFEQTVSRLREQLRKLEMETEAQILSRFQRESEQAGGTQFDPLELDRFSTLQQLSRALAESVSDLVSIQSLLDDIARQSETLLLQQSRVSSDLQEGLMRTRMVPFESLVPRLRRIVRQTAAELGKKAQLRVEGTQGEMDRTVLERMTAPFEHMLRNSLAHGIESPDIRMVRGKAEEGSVSIRVSREATEVLIQVTDDGAGMNRDAIRRKAIERGLMNPDAQLSDRDIYQFVLEPGFSTAAEVSKVAGRGVGMDVVASEVKQLGGSLEMDSDPGRGTRITIRLPFTLAVAQAVLVKLGESTFAIPMTSITGVTRMPRKEMDRRLEQKQLEISYGGETYQIYDLGDLLRSPVNHATDETQVPLLMSRTGDQRAAIRVSHVVGSKEVVVKSAGLQLSSVPGIFGATIMGDGRVVVILDLAPLVRHGVALRQAPELAAELELMEPLPEPTARRQPLVMVVDDSITMRKVTTRVLERADFDVFTAKDGLDAVEQLQDRMPDVILLDIEMPRMDGYEVATYIRNDQRLKHIPIIMITSRTGEKHRQRALEVGVDRYLGKPYQENDLLKNVQEALTAGHADVH